MKTAAGTFDNLLKNQIIGALKPIGIQKIVLFGSFAYGTATIDSDIDLLIVTSDDFIPDSFSEKQKISLKVNEALSFVRKSFSMDLIVHTKPMHEIFLHMSSAFQREISNKGIVLYEEHH